MAISTKYIRLPDVFGAVVIAVGNNVERTDQVGLAGSGSTKNNHIMYLFYVSAGSQTENLRFIQLPLRCEGDIFYASIRRSITSSANE